MSYFECPYCKKEASSFLTFGYAVLSGKKECPHCLGRIKANYLNFILIYLFGIPLLITLLFLLYLFSRYYESPFLFLLIIFIVGNFSFYVMIQCLAK